MVSLVRMFYGGIVKENGEFESMEEMTEMFDVAPTLQEVVECAQRNYRCVGDDEMTMRGQVDCCKGG